MICLHYLISEEQPQGEINKQPKKVSVTLHNPNEPGNLRSKSFEIPLGQTTTVYITPKAREIDEIGKTLKENQRNCRLVEDNSELEIFKVYTQEACLFECKIKIAANKCGCIPWSFPLLNVSLWSYLHMYCKILSKKFSFSIC